MLIYRLRMQQKKLQILNVDALFYKKFFYQPMRSSSLYIVYMTLQTLNSKKPLLRYFLHFNSFKFKCLTGTKSETNHYSYWSKKFRVKLNYFVQVISCFFG